MKKTLNKFKEVVNIAKDLGMEVIADVSPDVFKDLNVKINDLKVFKDIGLGGIRVDLGFSGNEESIMSYNQYGLKIELNISGGTKYIDNVMSYLPNKDNIIGCHNFYPHRYSGLSRTHFLEATRRFKQYGLRTAAFVSSQSATLDRKSTRLNSSHVAISYA